MVGFSPQAIALGAIKIWDLWSIRGAILFSLGLQTLLILIGPFRKSSRRKLLIMLIWSAYTLADSAATFALGLICNSQRSEYHHHSGPKEHPDLLAFWAPFLLLHLGGPDTVTAFSIEDNQLWFRHLFGLGLHAAAVVYVFLNSFPNNKLWLPAILVFIAGTIKYVERTLALYFASLDRFRNSILVTDPDPGPDYATLIDIYSWKKESKLPVKIGWVPQQTERKSRSRDEATTGGLDNLEVLDNAYRYFKILKGLLVDLVNERQLDEGGNYFNNMKAEAALSVVEVELNFMYGILYTKVEVVNKIAGFVIRLIASGLVLATLGLFHFKANKHEFNKIDVGITYTLLLVGIALDVIGFLMIILSDRTCTYLSRRTDSPCSMSMAAVLSRLLNLKSPWFQSCQCKKDRNKLEAPHNLLATPLLFRRWSGSVPRHNLIRYCLKRPAPPIHQFPSSWKTIMEEITKHLPWLRTVGDISNKVMKPVIDFLDCATKKVHNCMTPVIHFRDCAKEKVHRCMTKIKIKISESCMRKIRRNWLLGLVIRKVNKIFSPLKDHQDEMKYVATEPLTKELWHFIFEELKKKMQFASDHHEEAKVLSSTRGEWVLEQARDILEGVELMQYVTNVPYDESLLLWHIATDLCYDTEQKSSDHRHDETAENWEWSDHQQFSKLLSDYMLYLLVFQPKMMYAVSGIWKTRFQDTCAEAKRFFSEEYLESKPDEKEAREAILSVSTDLKPLYMKGSKSKSVLFDANMLAKELRKLEREKKWQIISRVWVELVSYAASHCTGPSHAQQLSKGGELITFVWLLMAHTGLGRQIQIVEGKIDARMWVGK